MSFPGNAPYERRYSDPQHRPSNHVQMRVFDSHGRRRIAEVACWLDAQEVIAEAEAALRGERPAKPQLRRADPGE